MTRFASTERHAAVAPSASRSSQRSGSPQRNRRSAHRWLARLSATLLFVAGADLQAQDSPPGDAPPADAPAAEAPADEVRLLGGDRLTGTVTAITADGVEIEATSLGADPVTVTVAPDRIESLSVSSPLKIQTAGGERLEVDIEGITPTELLVGGGSDNVALGDLVGVTPLVEWTGSFNAGIAYATGNTERRSGTAAAEVIRRTDANRLRVRGTWDYAQERSTDPTDPPASREFRLTQRRTYGAGKYDHFLGDATYALANISAENDEIADLKLRLITGVGIGYQFADSDDLSFATEAGVTYIDERRGQGPDSGYIAARLATSLRWEIMEDLTLLQDSELYPGLEETDDIYGRFDTRLRTTLGDGLFAQLQWIFDYDNTPARRSNGSSFDRQDHRLLLTVGWSF